jgi:phage tail sheath protein FI
MAEILSPGVFIEEVPSAVQVVQPVSTSNMGIVGATQRGPTDEATLVTSFSQFTRLFGPLIADSRTGLSMSSYFANGGRRAFVVRVMPADAVEAGSVSGDEGFLTSARRDFQCNIGDGVTAVITEAVLTPTALVTPVVGAAGEAGVSIRWRSDDIENGTNLTFAFAAGVVTLTSNEALFTAAMVGKQITIAGATTPANDGNYVIASYIDPSNVTYANVAGVAEVGAGTWVVDEAAADGLFERDGTTPLVQDTVGHPLAHYEGRVVTFMPSDGVDSSLPSIAPGGTLTLHWLDSASAAATLSLAQVGTTMRATGTTGAGSVAELDLITGYLTVTFAGADLPVVADDGNPIQLTYQPETTVRSISDDGSGAIPADGTILTGAGTITYATAAYSFTTNAGYEPGTACPVLVDYDIEAWDLDPTSVGTWADDMRVESQGNDDYYTVTTDTYTRFNINIRLLNSATGDYDIVESYEEITFTDVTSAQYFPDVLNDLSDLLNVVEPALTGEGPQQLNGLARSLVVAAGDELIGNRQITTTLLDVPIVPRSFQLDWTDDTATARSITDDGAGNLIGDVDGAGTNTIDYTTGAIDVLLSDPIQQDQLVPAVYRSVSEEEAHTDVFTGGSDGTFDATNYGRNQFTSPTLEPNFQGLYALNKIEELMQVVIPDFAGDVQITKDLIDYAEARKSLPSGGDRFIILMVPQGSTAQEAVDFLRLDVGQNTAFAAMYWPWVKIANPLADNRPLVFPPLGHIAGIYARTDSTRNVGKVPAGTVDGALRNLIGLEIDQISQGERDVVYPARINPLISGPQTGLAVWGARTISLQSEWRYINARRLFMFVEKSVYNATHWIVFENNGPGLWARIKAQLQAFLTNLFNDGLFAGTTPAQAFFVIVDESNNDQASIDAGQVIIDVGIAPNRPAEFVRFRFQQKTLDS